jgi:hypothetical protein
MKTLIYVYFSGHGAFENNETSIILNGPSIMYPLEKMLRCIGGMKGTYVVALLDCCREKLDSTKWRGV